MLRLNSKDLAACLVGFVAFGHPPMAIAEILDIAITSTATHGEFEGKKYQKIEATVRGRAPGGKYSIPLTIAFAADPQQRGDVAIVDVVNTVTIGEKGFVIGGAALPTARIHMGDTFLFGGGRSYFAPIWDKKAVEQLKNGSISASADGYTILADISKLARDPAELIPDGPTPSNKVIAYGYSQTGALLRDWFAAGRNDDHANSAFDAGLIISAGSLCLDLGSGEYRECTGDISGGIKVINVAPETDVELGGHLERAEGDTYRHIEVAGVPHIPADAADFRSHGLPDQNHIGYGPVARAAVENLEGWLAGKNPFANLYMELADGPVRMVQGNKYRAVKRDAAGNGLGGVRLPHLATSLPRGKDGGAPLGVSNGLNWKHEQDNYFFFIAGRFEPFPDEKVKELYPTRDVYVDRVKAAAEHLLGMRYIIKSDADAYVAEAQSKPPW